MGIQNIAVTKYFISFKGFQIILSPIHHKTIKAQLLTSSLLQATCNKNQIVNYPFFKYYSSRPYIFIIPTHIITNYPNPNHNHLNSMQLDECANSLVYRFQQNDMFQKFTLKQITQARPQEILQIIVEKDRMIRAFSQQITKFKAQQLKAKKLISSLQEKIQKTLPSGTNTSNSFMIPSEFKALFTAFMTSTIPSVFYDFTQHPKMYSILLKSILQGVYSKLQQILQKKTEEIRAILLEGTSSQQEGNSFQKQKIISEDQNIREQIRYHLLSFMQKYFQRIFPSNLNKILSENQQSEVENDKANGQSKALFQIQFPTTCELNEQIGQKIETLNSEQTQDSDQLKQFFTELYRICIYMILQQHPWQFVFDSQYQAKDPQNQSVKYTKKQFTCIDGFVKQGSEVRTLLKGLRRKENSSKEYHYHPNIKNFVLPTNEDEEQLPLSFQLRVDILFFEKFNNIQQVAPSPLQQNVKKEALRDITQSHQGQLSIKLPNQPSYDKNLPNLNKAPQTNIPTITKSSLPLHKPKIISEQSFRLEAISQTQKSQLIQSSLMHRQTPLIENDSNCIIDLTESYTLKRKHSHKEQTINSQDDKENVNENSMKPDKKLSTNTKKEKTLEKNMKRHKKEKNNSTIDLTAQKNKVSHKDHAKDIIKENLQGEVHKKRQQDLPLTRDIPKSSKKKGVGKSSRKCSVGKIVSQSTQIISSNTNTKQKISLSQHNTVAMKQSLPTKPLKDNFIIQAGHRQCDNKQNISSLVGHMYQKQIMRPKKSAKLTKTEDKPLVLSVVQTQKQQRPLAMRAYQNSCLVGKLREKYLVG